MWTKKDVDFFSWQGEICQKLIQFKKKIYYLKLIGYNI